jgi:hypothetical protein
VRNDENGEDYTGTPPVRRCGYCGQPLLSQRRGAKFCSREHKELARQRRQRAGERLTTLRGRHPFADLPEFSDELDLIGQDDEDHQDDEYGIVSNDSSADSWQERNELWAARQEFADAIEAVNADFKRRAAKYLGQQRRNAGTKLPELAGLERERDARIAELTRVHHLAEAYAMAERDRPGRIASARERAAGQAAARSFAADLGRGHFLRAEPEPAGRDVHSAWRW